MFKENQNLIIGRVINDLEKKFIDNIITMYGIGSYFDKSLPIDWIKKDIDIIVIVKSLNSIPKIDWTEVRYERKKIEDYEIWIAFNTLKAYQTKENFKKESFSNYEWSLLDLKIPNNSHLLYGKDIREQLPDITKITFDFDDILARSLYHFDKSFRETIESKNIKESIREFTKGVFKFGFYLCIFFNKNFQSTSIRSIANNIEEISKRDLIDKIVLYSMKQSILFRRTNNILDDFIKLRNNLILYIFSIIGKGKLHYKMKYEELISFLSKTFQGLNYLIKFLKNIKEKFLELKSEDI